ncbi:MAG: hypothetical protein KF753_12050 [Caldilineaceae bacterium]|nr:hypothetical protein [Caldilineaceae bacterium]
MTTDTERTEIYRRRNSGDEKVGFIDSAGVIQRLRWDEGIPIGRVELRNGLHYIWRKTRHDEKEVGTATADGAIRSHGLFEGGELGWLEPDGVVMQGGLILAEEEVGRVEGPQSAAAAAALLLIFLPEEEEAGREMKRR